MTYSLGQICLKALGNHKGWKQAWRSPEPKSHYDIVIIGGGGHGLATAYYLAKEHDQCTNSSNVNSGTGNWLAHHSKAHYFTRKSREARF